MYTARPRFVRAGNDAGTLHAIGHRHRTLTQRWLIQLFDGSEKGIHVDKDNGAGPILIVHACSAAKRETSERTNHINKSPAPPQAEKKLLVLQEVSEQKQRHQNKNG
jgi:hypothetical protein